VDRYTREHRFDIGLLGRRVVDAVDWAQAQPELRALPVATFGASTGAAAAPIAAAERPQRVRAVVSRGGRPDLAAEALEMRHMRAPVELEILPGATHLFEEPGALEEVARLAASWCKRHL
jgi:dienelactone hydrolase